MKRNIYIILMIQFILTSCGYFEYDNYESPNSGILGEVVDYKTNELILGEAANSYKIEYYELSWEQSGHQNTQSRFFWGKADGTFKNSKIFAGDYKISLKEGAFYSPEPQILTLKNDKLSEINFKVIPYSRVKIDRIEIVGENNNNLKIQYTIEDTENEINKEIEIDPNIYTLSEAQIFLSSKSPNVGVNNTETQYTMNAKYSFIRGENYTPGIPITITDNSIKDLKPGKYWLRIGVRTNNPYKRYNFSTIQEITISNK